MTGRNEPSVRWYRVFAVSDREPEPAALVEQLRRYDPEARGDFRGDDRGWFAARLNVGGHAIAVARYLTEEEDLRGELNAWAAWVEATGHPESARLMQQLIGTRQLFALQPDGAELSDQARALCCWLAGATAGIIQIDGEGWLAANGAALLPEP